MRILTGVLALVAAFLAHAAPHAAPSSITAVYELYRNGQKLGQVSDRLEVSGTNYTLSSTSTAQGALALLWKGTIRLESTGTVTDRGLRPERFSHARSDRPERNAAVSFDWSGKKLDYLRQGKRRVENGLIAGTQDQISQLYQFAYMPAMPGDFALQVVGPKDSRDYRYVASDGGTLATPFGQFATRRYARVARDADDKAVEVWIAPGKHRLPLRVRVIEDGVTLEQRLISLKVSE